MQMKSGGVIHEERPPAALVNFAETLKPTAQGAAIRAGVDPTRQQPASTTFESGLRATEAGAAIRTHGEVPTRGRPRERAPEALETGLRPTELGAQIRTQVLYPLTKYIYLINRLM